jgi:dynein heavy chain 1, cytosolic
MLRYLITEMYGGKIDSEADFSVLSSLVNSILTPAAFEEDYDIVRNVQLASSPDGTSSDALVLPSGAGWQGFMQWVNDLPEREPPTYLGLPANAEKLLLEGQARKMVGDLRVILEMLDEGEQIMAEADAVD